MKRITLLTMFLLACFAASVNLSPASAGGWALTSLDPFDQPVAGEPVTVGFTILQHGVTPVDVEDVAIRIASPGQPSQLFTATSDGPNRVGHYTASVVFPAAGTFSWSVEQGWFGSHDLGEITIAAGTAGGSALAGETWQYSSLVRYGLPLVAAMCAAIALREGLRGRRRLTSA